MNKQKLIATTAFVLSVGMSLSFLFLKDFFKGATSLGLLGIFLSNAFASASFFLSGPAFLTVIAGGSLYPPVLVALAGSLGSASGDMVGFVLGHSGRKIIEHKIQGHLLFRVFEKLFKRHGTWLLFLFALIPNPIFDSVGIFAGVFTYPWKKFFIIVFLGRFIRFLGFAFLGWSFR